MRVLITGAAGFVGHHLAAELTAHGHEPVALCLPGEKPPPGVPSVAGDIVRESDLREAIGTLAPDGCFHLAGVSSVPRSWADPARAFDVNLAGTIHLLDAARALRPALRIVVVSSSHIYGEQAGDAPLDETAAPRPASPYAISKAAADQISLAYASHFGMAVMTARPANHIGPGQSMEFVIPAHAAQLAAIAGGRAEAVLRIGNLESRRDFMDVRDTVRGYRLLLEHGRPGLAYHMAGGRLDRISDLLDRLCAIAGVSPARIVEPSRWRPADTSPRLDCSRILRDTGWRPEIPIERTLQDVYEDVRARINT